MNSKIVDIADVVDAEKTLPRVIGRVFPISKWYG
jgi:hypothetical protein